MTTIIHHPSDVTLGAFASGTLDEARAVVVATHVAVCPQCQRGMRAFEHVGGAFLEAAAPAGMSAEALERAMARLDSAVPSMTDSEPITPVNDLPAPLNQYALGRWRSIGGGLQTRPIQIPSNDGVRVFLLKGGPGTRLPRHRHTGTEWTCVIQGAYHDEQRRYGPGDFDEVDESIEHDQVVEDGMPCIAVVAMQGGIKLQGWVGRLLQPFIRI
jgi:putative transcriptional regulator